MHQSGGKKPLFLDKFYLVLLYSQPFRILIGRSQNLLNIALRKSWMLGYFKCSNYDLARRGAAIYQMWYIAAPRGAKSLNLFKKD